MLFRVILDSDDQNVIFVGWSKGSSTFLYSLARERVKEVGKAVADFTKYLVENNELDTKKLRMVGFSLGAHVAGIAGKNLNGEVNKIVGLDPAGPLFDVNDPENRLSPESAEYTECIHTGFPLGIRDPICHLDFYMNKGLRQPGCVSKTGVDNVICSHIRAVAIFMEALVNEKAFHGYNCAQNDNNNDQQRKSINLDVCKSSPDVYINNDQNNEMMAEVFSIPTNDKSPYGRRYQQVN